MPSWSEHRKYCMEHGIGKEICDFVNRLVDFPEEYVPKYLNDPVIREFISSRLNISVEDVSKIAYETEIMKRRKEECKSCTYKEMCRRQSETLVIILEKMGLRCPLIGTFPFAITHSKVHMFWEKIIQVEYGVLIHSEFFKRVIREIARYFYGEKGVKAVDLHLELDEIHHVLKKVKDLSINYLTQGIQGVASWPAIMPVVALVRKYVFKDPQMLRRILIKTGNLEIFLVNLIWLLPTKVESLFEAYDLRYNGILKDKTIIELINDYKEKFNKFINLLKFLSKDIREFEYFNKLRELSDLRDEEIEKELSKMFSDYDEDVIEEIKHFITSKEFKKFLEILNTLI